MEYTDEGLRQVIGTTMRYCRNEYKFRRGTLKRALKAVQYCRLRLHELPADSRDMAMHNAIKSALLENATEGP